MENKTETSNKVPSYLKRISTMEKDIKQLTVKINNLEKRMNNILKALKRS